MEVRQLETANRRNTGDTGATAATIAVTVYWAVECAGQHSIPDECYMEAHACMRWRVLDA